MLHGTTGAIGIFIAFVKLCIFRKGMSSDARSNFLEIPSTWKLPKSLLTGKCVYKFGIFIQ